MLWWNIWFKQPKHLKCAQINHANNLCCLNNTSSFWIFHYDTEAGLSPHFASRPLFSQPHPLFAHPFPCLANLIPLLAHPLPVYAHLTQWHCLFSFFFWVTAQARSTPRDQTSAAPCLKSVKKSIQVWNGLANCYSCPYPENFRNSRPSVTPKCF